jgi:hypothetical protein
MFPHAATPATGLFGAAGAENLKKQPIDGILAKREDAQRTVVAYLRSGDRRGGVTGTPFSQYTLDLFSEQLTATSQYRVNNALVNVHAFAFTGGPNTQSVLALNNVKQILIVANIGANNVIQSWKPLSSLTTPGCINSNILAVIPAIKSGEYLLDNQPIPVLCLNPLTSVQFTIANQDGVPLHQIIPEADYFRFEHHMTLKIEYLG